MKPPFQLRPLLSLAEETAKQAGSKLVRPQAEWRAAEVSGRDIKLAADRAAEAMIRQALEPSAIPILGEETGWQGQEGAETFWVVDPLDGTANYHLGLPLWCVAIALVREGSPVLGVIHDPLRGETFAGVSGEGAWLNGIPISVSAVAEQSSAVLATGLPVKRDFSPEAMEEFGRSLGAWRKVRMLGSAALSMAYVACGRADCYREDGIMLWDIAAGAAIIRGAGGRVEIKGTGPTEPQKVLATNGVLAVSP